MIDVLVIGSGGAGLVAAIAAKEAGADVTVVSKSFPTRSQTCMAQGGINCVNLGDDSSDSVEAHIEDTFRSSQGLGDIEAIRKLCSRAESSIEWLDTIGVPFSRTRDAKVAQRQMGGASAKRACHAQDYTGLKILHTLYDRASKLGINFVNEHFLLNLIVEKEGGNSHVSGATFLDMKTSMVVALEAKSIIMATGGYSQLYHGFSTNSTQATGDGLAVAFRAGAKLADMEFVQFHPTALKNSAILISESARGAGGHLLNANYERFTDEVAPRDVVARAIDAEIKEGSGAVYLDIRHLGEAYINKELPQERKLAIEYEGVDPVVDLIPIKSVAHYTMGGIDVNSEGMSCIHGLFAAGEAANHRVHGANRLGGNSLLELVVFGKESGENAAYYAKHSMITCENRTQIENDKEWIDRVFSNKGESDFYAQRVALGEMFYTQCGIVREEDALVTLLKRVQLLKSQEFGISDDVRGYNTNLTEYLEFLNVLEVSEAVVTSALNRKESRGAHFREDFAEKDEEYRGHSVIKNDMNIDIGV